MPGKQIVVAKINNSELEIEYVEDLLENEINSTLKFWRSYQKICKNASQKLNALKYLYS